MLSLITAALEQTRGLLATVKHGIFVAVKNFRTLWDEDDRDHREGC
jgi:hypothetical protein